LALPSADFSRLSPTKDVKYVLFLIVKQALAPDLSTKFEAQNHAQHFLTSRFTQIYRQNTLR
ncbi:MAG: hypothetical protein AAGA77_25730, partial [Bacteroidota bacterium]